MTPKTTTRPSRSKKEILPSPPTHTDREFSELAIEAHDALTYLSEHPEIPLAVDTETTGLRIKDLDYCIGISIAFELDGEILGYYYPVAHPTGENIPRGRFERLAYVLENQEILLFQNAKFDLVSLQTAGIDCQQFFYDTCTISQLLDENNPPRKDLDSLALHYLGKEGKVKDPYVEAEKKSGNQHITWQEEWDYAVMDAVTTYELAVLLLDKLHDGHEPDLPDVWAHKVDLIRVLLVMEGRGVRVDEALAREMISKGEVELERIKAELGMNPGSHKDLTTLLIDVLKLPVLKTSPKTGAPSFDKTVMPDYEAMLERLDNPTARLVKEYRGWQKAVSASYKPYVELLSPDGRLRCNYRLDTARTGRFSCEKPNLQQIPKEGVMPWNENTKKCFIPQDGYVLVNADYSQLELRVGTAYAGEEGLKKVFEEGRDIFTEMSLQLGFDRQTTKTFVYSTQYGAGVKRIMSAFGVSREQAKKMLATYASTYPRFRAFSDRCAAKAEQAMKVRIWSGRYRHFQYESESYKAMNSVIQGGAADIMEMCMVRLFNEIDDDIECRMLLQVHDAIVFEIREDLVEQYIPVIREIMCDVSGSVGHTLFDVKFDVEAAPDYGSKGWSRAA